MAFFRIGMNVKYNGKAGVIQELDTDYNYKRKVLIKLENGNHEIIETNHYQLSPGFMAILEGEDEEWLLHRALFIHDAAHSCYLSGISTTLIEYCEIDGIFVVRVRITHHDEWGDDPGGSRYIVFPRKVLFFQHDVAYNYFNNCSNKKDYLKRKGTFETDIHHYEFEIEKLESNNKNLVDHDWLINQITRNKNKIEEMKEKIKETREKIVNLGKNLPDDSDFDKMEVLEKHASFIFTVKDKTKLGEIIFGRE